MAVESLAAVYATYIFASASPGPSVMAIMGTAMAEGRRPALTLALGVIGGSMTWAGLASLGLTPNFCSWRPCDQVETAVAWQAAIARQGGPTALILSRQNLAQMPRTPEQVQDIARGGYVLKDAGGKPDLILIATGSEVEITVLAAEKLLAKGVNVRVVSLPSTDVFDAQDEAWRESVLPSDVSARVAVEAGIADYWYKYVGLKGKIVGMTGYGESAPAEQLFPFFGFTVDHIVATAEQVLNG